MGKYEIRQRETGDVFECCEYIDTAKLIIDAWEKEDKNGCVATGEEFIPNFYEIYDTEKEICIEYSCGVNGLAIKGVHY